MNAFRPLLLFWACVIGILAGGAVALQLLGPLPAKLPPHHLAGRPGVPAGLASGPAPTAQTVPGAPPARALSSSPDPAPAPAPTLASIPDPVADMLEAADGFPARMLPRVDAAGHTAARQYAAAFDPAERHPRIAMVIDGAGLDRTLTAQAVHTLPAAMDLAFSAYAPVADAARIASNARRLGRECLVSVPMEPNGFPTNEEGNRALLTGADPAQTRANLDWALSSVTGCVGATGASDGQGGERFAGSRQAFADMLNAVAQRGLLYLDPRPGAPVPADATPERPLPYVADLVVDRGEAADQPADAQVIDRGLAALEQIAARRGTAIGLAGPLTPVLLDRLQVWSHGLAARGMVLAPLTAMPRQHLPPPGSPP